MRALPFAFLVLVACDSPSVAFRDAVTLQAEAGGSLFSIHAKANRVEVYRISREWRPKREVILARSRAAIEKGTGCRVVDGTLTGDQAIQRAEIAC